MRGLLILLLIVLILIVDACFLSVKRLVIGGLSALKRFSRCIPLAGYLDRVTIFRLGKLHVRIHAIHKPDATPYQHSHPFDYCTIVLSGGYTEEYGDKLRRISRGCIHCAKSHAAHRIIKVEPNTRTLFIAYYKKNFSWNFRPSAYPATSWIDYKKGVYKRVLSNKILFCKFDGYWRKGSECEIIAQTETQPSINQELAPIN